MRRFSVAKGLTNLWAASANTARTYQSAAGVGAVAFSQKIPGANALAAKRIAGLVNQGSGISPVWRSALGAVNVRGFRTTSRVELVIDVPPMGDSISEGSLAAVLKEPGDGVEVDEVIAQIETDKVTIDVRSPVNGVVGTVLVGEGDTVVVGQPLYDVTEGEAPPKKAAAPAAPAAPAAAPPTPTPAPAAPAAPKAAASAPAAAAPAAEKGERRVPMTRLRKRVAERLKSSQNTLAMLTTFNEIDMTNIMALRTQYKDEFEKKHGCKLGFMSAFVKASTYALQCEPAINGCIEGDDIVYKDYYDISIAVGSPKGLVVPVLRGTDAMSFADVEKNIQAYAKKAKDGTLGIDDMAGGTFTISNGGVYGSLMGTPIINPPQSAILGMHSIQKRPVVVDGEIKIRPMMYVALTYDHRLIDGREAVTFLRTIKDVVEDPRRLVLDI